MGVPGLVWFQWIGSYRSQSESNNNGSSLAFLIGLSRSTAACVAILGVSNDVIISFPLSLTLFRSFSIFLYFFIVSLSFPLTFLLLMSLCFTCSFHLLIPVCFLHTEGKVYMSETQIIFVYLYFNLRKKSFPTSSARKKKKKILLGYKVQFSW